MTRQAKHPVRAGLITLGLLALGVFFAFTKANPFDNPYKLEALFESANRLNPRSPVRIAGIEVGKVTKIESVAGSSGMARVTMEIDEEGLPIHEDAELKVRSRLFLEGNYFVDVHPGTPSARQLDSGETIPPNQTSSPVQFSQVLSTLQTETRADLQTFLYEYSEALRGRGASGFNQALRYQEGAYRDTAQVSDATLGREPHDLTRVLDGQAKVFGALSDNERALADLVTDLNDTVGGFARQESNLRAAVPELRDVLREGPPTLVALDRAFPSIRAFARDALPAARSSLPTLTAQVPFARQLRGLFREQELRGVMRELAATVPALVSLNRGTRLTLRESRALASCQNNVLIPFMQTPIPDPDFSWHTGEPFFEEYPRGLVGLAGESRIADANSPMFRVFANGGPVTSRETAETLEGPLYAQSLFPLLGKRPARPSRRPVFRPGVPCETQEPPNLEAPAAPAPEIVTPAGAP